MQKTKMIFTMGPSIDSENTLKEVIKIGLSAARLNLSHGTHETHKQKIDLIKKIREDMNSEAAIIIDIKGPKIRTHNFKNNSATLKEGDKFSFICNCEILGDNSKCSITYEDLYKDVKVGATILVDDGLLVFEVDSIENKYINCTVKVGGIITNHKGVNVPNININLPSVTEKDKKDIIFGCNNDIDFIAASFIRKASDILEIRDILKEQNNNHIKIIAKIENQEGVNNIDSIIEVSDGIMIARGDMGVEIPIEKIPIIQKKIIKKCNEAGKIVITATQMLDSMIRNSIPTRAEACDICNAIFDGTDAIMLSGETASGSFPIKAAKTMSKIAIETEKNLNYSQYKYLEPSNLSSSDAISYSACRTSNVVNAKAIIAATQSGATAKLICKYRPKSEIIAITPSRYVMRELALNFGVIPVHCKIFNTTDEILSEAKKIAKTFDFVKENDEIIVAAGLPTTHIGGTNMLKIEKV